MTLVYNCNEDVAVAAFISVLQVMHSFYKHLVKYEVTKMNDILFRFQKYIQIEDATWIAVNRSPKGEKPKPQVVFTKKNQNRAFDAINKPSPTEPRECQ